jgi:hypothetical protein
VDGALGAFALRSDTELLLKGRRVVPGRLLEAGFAFDHPAWPEAAEDRVQRRRNAPGRTERIPAPCRPQRTVRLRS